jgi:DNA-binding NtrC family response regulator
MRGKANVLVVDDELEMCLTLSDILEARGYRVTYAQDGFQAIARARETAFDVVLMDVRMPEMDGVETFRRLKKVSPGSRVVMMTAYAVEDLIADALREGAYGVVYKPLDIDRLIELVEAAKRHARRLVRSR